MQACCFIFMKKKTVFIHLWKCSGIYIDFRKNINKIGTSNNRAEVRNLQEVHFGTYSRFSPVVHSTDRSKAVVPVLVLLFFALWFILRGDPWVLNFPPCRGPGGSIPTGNVAGVVSSSCPLWEERRENTTRLPWVASRKPDEGVLEVEDYLKFSASGAQHTSLAWISVRRVAERSGTVKRLVMLSPRNNLFLLYQSEYTPFAHKVFFTTFPFLEGGGLTDQSCSFLRVRVYHLCISNT